MSTTDAAGIDALLKQLEKSYKNAELSGPPTEDTDPVEHLIWSALLWEATPVKAREAYKRLTDAAADLNELRVMLTEEFEDLLGPRYPMVAERAFRLRSLLADVYNREHDVTLRSLEKAQKREARKYLDSLEGVSPFVAARVFAVALGGHAVPVDEKLRDKLALAGVVEPDADPAAVAGSIERHIKASDSARAIALFEAWAADDAAKPVAKKPARRPAAKAAGKKSAAKKSTRKARDAG